LKIVETLTSIPASLQAFFPDQAKSFGASLFRMGKFDRLQPWDVFILILETV